MRPQLGPDIDRGPNPEQGLGDALPTPTPVPASVVVAHLEDGHVGDEPVDPVPVVEPEPEPTPKGKSRRAAAPTESPADGTQDEPPPAES